MTVRWLVAATLVAAGAMPATAQSVWAVGDARLATPDRCDGAQYLARGDAAACGIVQCQAAMLSYVGVFRGLGLVFVCLVPLVLLMKRPRTQAGAAAAH